jgi:hypothetical protein
VHLKLGQFIPETVPAIAKQRALTLNSYLLNTYSPSKGERNSAKPAATYNIFYIETPQLGIEVSGIVKGRLHYVFGLVNGNGADANNNNSAMDVFYRIAYKFGGLGFDGKRPLELSDKPASKKTERSFEIGTFGYLGTAQSGGHKVAVRRWGADCELLLGDINLINGLISGYDEEYIGDHSRVYRYALFLSEGRYMIYPWLAGILRYEQAWPEDLDQVTRIVSSVTALYTANVKFILEASVDPVDMGELILQAGMDFAF